MASVLPPCASSDSWSALTRSVRGRRAEERGERVGEREEGERKERERDSE